MKETWFRRLAVGLACLLAALCLPLHGACDSDQTSTEGVITVGAILPLTGQASNVGKAIQNGMELAYRQLPKEVQRKLRVIYEDDAMLPRNSVAAFQKLTTANKINILANASSQTGKALAPLAERKRIPFISISRDKEIIKNKKYVVTLWVRAEDEVKATIVEMKSKGCRKIARITSIHEGSLYFKEAFDRFNKGDFILLEDKEYPLETTDFRTFIAQLRTIKELEALLVLLQPGQIGIFARQLRQNQISVPIVGHSVFEDEKELEASNGALDGSWFVSPASANAEFRRLYKATFPQDSRFLAANGYDIIRLLGEAVQNSTDPEKINYHLHHVENFSGALGTYSATGTNRFNLPVNVKVVFNDTFKERQ